VAGRTWLVGLGWSDVAGQRGVCRWVRQRKVVAPSVALTSREIAERLGEVSEQPRGRRSRRHPRNPDARGTTVAGIQIHSVRLPSFVVSGKVLSALPDERLTIRHDARGTRTRTSAERCWPCERSRRAPAFTRGLDALLLSAD
jgi:4-hydroxy-tetrahydrodipicolinate reductase